jgi:hypothetical protein
MEEIKSMECEKVRDRFSSLMEGDLNPREEKIIREHLASCSGCRKELEHFEKTMHWLHSIEEVEVPEGFLSGIYKKVEERKSQATHGEKARWRWLSFPLSMKLPIQAVAMVAVVFLVIYLTQWTPFETFHLKEVGRKTASLPPKKEGALGRAVPQTPLEAPRLEEIDQLKRTVPEEKKMEGASAPKGIEEGRKVEKPSVAKEEALFAAKPAAEIVLKISDREKVIPQIEKLVKKFGGEIEKTEGNIFLVSLPAVSFSEFEKGMDELSSSKKEDKIGLQKRSAESLGVSPGGKRREVEEKDKGSKKPLSDRESHVIVRILLLQE